MTAISVRNAQPDDAEMVRRVHTSAFGSHVEADLVEQLTEDGQAAISLVAVIEGQVVGHVLFSPLEVTGTVQPIRALALAPLAVLPEWQRRGIGSRLVIEGIESSVAAGIDAIIVLGHPEYYRRFGSSAQIAECLRAPYSGPAFMALELTPGAVTSAAGALVRYPGAFSRLS
jgi:putative acetyltransferase